LLGETVYNRDYTDEPISCSRTLLHAAFLSFDHPVHQQRLEYEAPLPTSFQSVLDQERRKLKNRQ